MACAGDKFYSGGKKGSCKGHGRKESIEKLQRTARRLSGCLHFEERNGGGIELLQEEVLDSK